MSNKQTAVEWLISELTEYNLMNKDILPSHPIFNKAKELEKQQIIDAWLSAWKDSMINPLEDKYYKSEAEQYYTETYGGQDNEQ
jgi:hypothetical protein